MSPLRRVWAVPAAVGTASAAGLAGALVLDGAAARTAACLALAAPVAVVGWKLAAAAIRRPRFRSPGSGSA